MSRYTGEARFKDGTESHVTGSAAEIDTWLDSLRGTGTVSELRVSSPGAPGDWQDWTDEADASDSPCSWPIEDDGD